ncbi:MAG: glycine dehydrogenase (aminomethyl-transferring) [Thermoplasmata archaeon HGW-Thermoplasmata-1]|nr:MAG: glycine dehydrogenase (aminomethyl-transferring) [Thermoplasmata archaeon HGW-Thermoplasmata-1]
MFASNEVPLIRDIGRKDGAGALMLPEVSLKNGTIPEKMARKTPLELPCVSKPEVMRHYTKLSKRNYGLDDGIYPLGSCTMKYNPKINEEVAGWEEVANTHPYQDECLVQGNLELMYNLERALCEITGMDAMSLQPAAGAHGEFLGMLVARAYHEANGELEKRKQVILPDTAHGTNPASAAMAGFEIVEIKSNDDGTVDLENLKGALSEKTAAFMLTNPNTLGIFENQITEIAKLVHEAGALLYYDGANMNAIMGKARPGDMGFDIVHLNLHKTFASPHGCGGPGSGPVGVKERLAKFLPVPRVAYDEEEDYYFFDYDEPESIGKVHSFYGNFSVLVRAYTYISMMGADGLMEATEIAVLNANYMKEKLTASGKYTLPFKRLRKHEFVASGEKLLEKKGVRTMDIVKRLMDYGMHPPTVYFPHLVHEAIMIEPTESEPKQALDDYVNVLLSIADEDAEVIKSAPHNTPVGRIDEAGAAKNLVLTWKMMKE